MNELRKIAPAYASTRNRNKRCFFQKALLPPFLKINQTNDAYEQEANLNAEAVMHAPEKSSTFFMPSFTNSAIQKKTTRDTKSVRILSVQQTLTSNGHALDSRTRSFMEQRFDSDFGNIRIHNDSLAHQSSRDMNARAYTDGNHIVFGAGEYQPNNDSGKKLLAHELTHTIQQNNSRSPLGVQRQLVYGSGYSRRYSTDAAEIASVQASTWFPATIDFAATASNSGGGTGEATFVDLLKFIKSQSPGSISSLGLIGHANAGTFGLGGRITSGNVYFTTNGMINATSIKNNLSSIVAIRNRFKPNAKIILYGCNAGAGTALLNEISNAFQVCAEGFTGEILTCIEWNSHNKVTSRGKVYFDAVGIGGAPCSMFYPDVKSLHPDEKSCVGVPVPVVPKP